MSKTQFIEAITNARAMLDTGQSKMEEREGFSFLGMEVDLDKMEAAYAEVEAECDQLQRQLVCTARALQERYLYAAYADRMDMKDHGISETATCIAKAMTGEEVPWPVIDALAATAEEEQP